MPCKRIILLMLKHLILLGIAFLTTTVVFEHWNVSLQERADGWIQRCSFGHEHNIDLAENLFFDNDLENGVLLRGLNAWHVEKSDWGYSNGDCSTSCHFTAMVWAHTTTVGCSAYECPVLKTATYSVENAMLFACYYYPRGNFFGHFPYKRGKPCSECAEGDTCSDGLCVSSGPESKTAIEVAKLLQPLQPSFPHRPIQRLAEYKALEQTFYQTSSNRTRDHRHHLPRVTYRLSTRRRQAATRVIVTDPRSQGSRQTDHTLPHASPQTSESQPLVHAPQAPGTILTQSKATRQDGSDSIDFIQSHHQQQPHDYQYRYNADSGAHRQRNEASSPRHGHHRDFHIRNHQSRHTERNGQTVDTGSRTNDQISRRKNEEQRYHVQAQHNRIRQEAFTQNPTRSNSKLSDGSDSEDERNSSDNQNRRERKHSSRRDHRVASESPTIGFASERAQTLVQNPSSAQKLSHRQRQTSKSSHSLISPERMTDNPDATSRRLPTGHQKKRQEQRKQQTATFVQIRYAPDVSRGTAETRRSRSSERQTIGQLYDSLSNSEENIVVERRTNVRANYASGRQTARLELKPLTNSNGREVGQQRRQTRTGNVPQTDTGVARTDDRSPISPADSIDKTDQNNIPQNGTRGNEIVPRKRRGRNKNKRRRDRSNNETFLRRKRERRARRKREKEAGNSWKRHKRRLERQRQKMIMKEEKRRKKLAKREQKMVERLRRMEEKNRGTCEDKVAGCSQRVSTCDSSLLVKYYCPMTCGLCKAAPGVPARPIDNNTDRSSNRISTRRGSSSSSNSSNSSSSSSSSSSGGRSRSGGNRVQTDNNTVRRSNSNNSTHRRRDRLAQSRRRPYEGRGDHRPQSPQPYVYGGRDRSHNRQHQTRQPETTTPIPATTPGPVGPCQDNPGYARGCKHWAERGLCERNELIQKVHCKRSCGWCS